MKWAILLGLAWMLLSSAPARAAVEPLPVREIAAGIFLHPGLQEDMTPENFGDIANVGFVVGAKCVAVIDTGGTKRVGERLRATVKRATALPICYVINTHVHPDHIFGNAAFTDDKPTFVGHHKLPAAMAARGRVYVNALNRDLAGAAQGSEIVAPTLTVKDELVLDLGSRSLRLKAWPTAHTDNDLTIYDERTSTLWVSDLLFVERIPVLDGNLRGWLKVIAELNALKPERVVPGHGLIMGSWQDAFGKQERYLTSLLDEVRAAVKARETIQQTVARLGASEQSQWLLFDLYHKRNVTAAYAELEWED